MCGMMIYMDNSTAALTFLLLVPVLVVVGWAGYVAASTCMGRAFSSRVSKGKEALYFIGMMWSVCVCLVGVFGAPLFLLLGVVALSAL